MARKRDFRCGTHGYVRHAFVCGHLVSQPNDTTPLVWFQADADGDEDDDCVGEFWCGACDERLQRDGEWNDENEALADIRLVCEFCLTKILARHEQGHDANE